MSKKLAAGSTHLLIDLPVGPTAKVTNAMEAMRLRKLFEFVGDHFGIAVEVITTDGRQPIGSGIGPVLEAQDVMAVLANDAGRAAPTCARNRCGSPRICWNTIRAARRHRLCARPRIARQRRGAQADAEDHRCPGAVGLQHRLRKSDRRHRRRDDGVIAEIDCLRLNRLARTAGAPIDKGAGIRLFKKIGDRVEKGEPLYRIHAFDQSEFDLARDRRQDRLPATRSVPDVRSGETAP